MKKIFLITFLALISAIAVSAETKEELIQKATYAGFSYKKAVEYAELKLTPDFVPEQTDGIEDTKALLKIEKKNAKGQKAAEKNAAKLAKYEAKIAAGEEKFAAFAEANPSKAEEKKAKIQAKTLQNLQRTKAMEAYTEYVYEDQKNEEIPINPKTGFPEILETPFVIFDEGVTFDMITRLQEQDDYNRSNFVWQDYLIGAYFDVTTVNMKPLNSMLRVSAYYPFYHTFDGMQQYAKQTILYAFDVYYGPVIHANMWNYVNLNFSAGPHYMYQLSDEYHLNYLGLGALAGIELPVARRWTIVNNGTFTLDYANLGTNKRMQPFDYSWSYQLSLGVRYSKKKLNKYAYIHHLDKAE